MKYIIRSYKNGAHFKFPFSNKYGNDLSIVCNHADCGANFNIHITLKGRMNFRCPQCLKYISSFRHENKGLI